MKYFGNKYGWCVNVFILVKESVENDVCNHRRVASECANFWNKLKELKFQSWIWTFDPLVPGTEVTPIFPNVLLPHNGVYWLTKHSSSNNHHYNKWNFLLYNLFKTAQIFFRKNTTSVLHKSIPKNTLATWQRVPTKVWWTEKEWRQSSDLCVSSW